MMPTQPAWTYEHSVDCEVPVQFAWDFWTNVKNWVLDADVESVVIDGPFAEGARGLTNSRSSGPIEWRLVEVRVGRAVIEFPLPGAVGQCVWTFADAARCTRITQRWTLRGEQADTYSKAIAAGLEAGIPAGMKKLCNAMEKVARVDEPSISGG
jgi:hypothetical protein